MIDTIQAFAGTWFTPYFLKKINDNTNSVLKLNNLWFTIILQIVTFLFVYTWKEIIILLHFIFKRYPFIDLVQMYYNFTKYIVLWNYAVKCNLESLRTQQYYKTVTGIITYFVKSFWTIGN